MRVSGYMTLEAHLLELARLSVPAPPTPGSCSSVSDVGTPARTPDDQVQKAVNQRAFRMNLP